MWNPFAKLSTTGKKGKVVSSWFLYIALPLAPVLAEVLVKGTIDGVVLTLAASMYCIGIATCSQRVLVFCIGLFMGILYALGYGFAVGKEDPQPPTTSTSTSTSTSIQVSVNSANISAPAKGPAENHSNDLWWKAVAGIVCVGILHAVERKERHYDDNEEVINLR